MINAKRIEEMKRLSTEATEGSWVTGKPLHAHKSYITQGSRLGTNIANAYHYEDAQFIAESRQFVPDIITAYEAQAEEIAKLQKALEFYANEQTYSYAVDVGFGGRRLYKIDKDEGSIAREALSWRNTTRK